MALTLLDHIAPGRGRFEAFLAGAGNPHFYMCHVGAGWAVARLPCCASASNIPCSNFIRSGAGW